jgi:predicted lipase
MQKGVSALVKKYPQAEILVTGHSLGAAMSAFAVLDVQQIAPVTHYYSLETPRVGNKAFADYMEKVIP